LIPATLAKLAYQSQSVTRPVSLEPRVGIGVRVRVRVKIRVKIRVRIRVRVRVRVRFGASS